VLDAILQKCHRGAVSRVGARLARSIAISVVLVTLPLAYSVFVRPRPLVLTAGGPSSASGRRDLPYVSRSASWDQSVQTLWLYPDMVEFSPYASQHAPVLIGEEIRRFGWPIRWSSITFRVYEVSNVYLVDGVDLGKTASSSSPKAKPQIVPTRYSLWTLISLIATDAVIIFVIFAMVARIIEARRTQRRRCRKCGYQLTFSTRCPECENE